MRWLQKIALLSQKKDAKSSVYWLKTRQKGCSGSYRYGFQGQEEDDETGWVNYKYRMHDPRIGRFFAVDPLTSEFPWNSPYAFSENRVIDAIELEGLESVVISGQKNATTNNPNRGFDNKFIKNSGEKIAKKLGYSTATYTTGQSFIGVLKAETVKAGAVENIVIVAHGTATSLYGTDDAGFYANNLSDAPNELGAATVQDLINATEGGWFSEPEVTFSNDAVMCFLSCRAGKEYDASMLEQITLATGVTTIGASAGVNKNGTGSDYIYRAGKGSSYYNDTEAVWYKFERVNNPTTLFGIKLWDNYSVTKTQISEGTDLDLRDTMPTQEDE